MCDTLFDNRVLFVTKDNPALGYTNVVEHHIHVKPNIQSKHQQPYRLSPNRKEVLRHQLQDLLDKGIVAPVSPSEDVPITSPIVLVSKRSKPKPEQSEHQKALSMYRFCVDFRYLNSQIQYFRYQIPNLDDLTESFTQREPNYITTINLNSGYFQMPISEQSSKYTVFNTCFGTFKFLRLPMGLKTSASTFQLLMDKVLHGLTYNIALCYLDDVLISSSTFTQHIAELQKSF